MRYISMALMFATLPGIALAHPRHDLAGAFLPGLTHPIGGADHVLAMVAVGLWAAVTGGRAIWSMPLAFLAALVGGGVLGRAGIAVPMVEPMILASVVLLGVAAALALRVPVALGLAGIAVFGAAHGVAHGVESPAAGFVAFGAGFVVSTLALHLVGLAVGLALVRMERRGLARGLGGLTAVAGLALVSAGAL